MHEFHEWVCIELGRDLPEPDFNLLTLSNDPSNSDSNALPLHPGHQITLASHSSHSNSSHSRSNQNTPLPDDDDEEGPLWKAQDICQTPLTFQTCSD